MYVEFASHQSSQICKVIYSKLMIISITHRIMDAKLYGYWFIGN